LTRMPLCSPADVALPWASRALTAAERHIPNPLSSRFEKYWPVRTRHKTAALGCTTL
jgi:hypothetical protein